MRSRRRPDIDGQRTMAMGGSFGGYMTNWIGSQTDRYACLITHASRRDDGDVHGRHRITRPWWYLEMGGENPYADPERFDRYGRCGTSKSGARRRSSSTASAITVARK